MNRRTALRRATLTGLAAAGIVALGTTSAMAHVTITPSTTAAGATADLRVEIPHGCVGSATTAITIRVPEGVSDVTASGTGRWAVEQAADAVTWTTDEPLPDAEHAEVEFSVRLPDDDGATLVFPVIQRCEQGEAAWTEVAEHGEGHEGLERPAPVLVVTPGEPGAGSETADADAEASASPGTEAPTETADAASPSAPAGTEVAGGAADADARNPLIAYGAAGVLVAGVLAGGAVLLRRRRRP
ncbi:YcnI family protein [Promicromonospora sp. NPDC050249]|uniref:YcnI family copper-binding membrane protein n=1 Tax=Promicromonospora sp. NPDC050249 TaxID=3154743 RepID=UPI0033C4163A